MTRTRFSDPAMLAITRDARKAGQDAVAAMVDLMGSGVVSGGLAVSAQSVPDMTISVGAGTCYLPSGRRYHLATAKDLTVGAVDEDRARFAVVYISADRKATVLSALGTAAVAGEKTFEITTNAVADDTVTIGGVEFTAVAAEPTGSQFVPGEDEAETAANLAAAIGENVTITADYDVSVDGATITLTEITAGGGNTPADATTTGTAVIANGTAVTSAAAVDPTMPSTPTGGLLLAEIELDIGASAVEAADITDERTYITTLADIKAAIEAP